MRQFVQHRQSQAPAGSTVIHRRTCARTALTVSVAMAVGLIMSPAVSADLLRLDAPSPMFNASALPTPWWVTRHGVDEDFDDSSVLGFGRMPRLTDNVSTSPWTNGWTLSSRASHYVSNPANDSRPGLFSDLTEHAYGQDHTGLRINFTRELLPESANGTLALGLGWALVDSSSGTRGAPLLSLRGKVGLGGRWSLYGQSAWLADTGEFGIGRSGDTLEAGLSWNPTDDLSLRAGYRRSRIRLGDDSGSLNNGETSGFILGAGFRW